MNPLWISDSISFNVCPLTFGKSSKRNTYNKSSMDLRLYFLLVLFIFDT